MQSNWVRLVLAAAAVAVAVVLFVVLSDDDEESSSTPAVTTQSDSGGGAGGGGPEATIPTIEVEGGQPVGGVQELSFGSGDQIRFRVTADAPAEVHFHGYDVMMDVGPGKPVTFDVPADIEGIFEVELEETAVQIAEVRVGPG
jgi:hypothetical protein